MREYQKSYICGAIWFPSKTSVLNDESSPDSAFQKSHRVPNYSSVRDRSQSRKESRTAGMPWGSSLGQRI
jgi:hypothetical protein